MKNIIEKLDVVVTDVLNHNEIIFLKRLLNSSLSALETEISLTMSFDEIQEEIEKQIEMAEYVDEDTCSNVSVELLNNVLRILYTIEVK